MNEEIGNYKIDNEIDIEKIISEYSNYLRVVIKNICGNYLSEEDIEEVLLDTFLALWKNKNILNDYKPIKPYISSIAHNLTKKKMTQMHQNQEIGIYICINDFINIFVRKFYYSKCSI